MVSSMSISLRRAFAPTLFSKLIVIDNPVPVIRSTSVLPSVSRSFNTNAQITDHDQHSCHDADRRSDRYVSRHLHDFVPSFISDVFEPFSHTRSLRQMLNVMDQSMDKPFPAWSRRGWDVKENNEALFLRMDMPGLSKDNVRISVEQNTLVMRGQGEEESDEEEGARRYSSRLDLPPNLYKVDSVKAEMKNGVLKVIVPKVKKGEREDVFQVKIN